MKKSLTLIIIALFAFIINAQGQTTGDFQSKSTGSNDWNNYATWQIYDGSAWVDAVSGQLPTSTSTVTIIAGDIRTCNATATCKNLIINGSLTLNTNFFTLTGDLTINGTFSLNGYISLAVAGNLFVNSTFLLNGILNVTGNATVNGTLTLGYYSPSTINGNLSVAGSLVLNSYNLNLKGNLINTGTINSDDAVNSSLTFNGSAQQTISGSGTFQNNNIRNLVINNTSLTSPGVDLQFSLSISNAITLTAGSLGTTNASVLTLGRSASSASLSIVRGEGSFDVSLVPPTNLIFNFAGLTSTTVQYASLVNHNINSGAELPNVPISQLMINTLGNIILTQPVSCGTLTMYAGIVTTSATNLITVTGTTAGSVFGGSSTNYVKGPLARYIPAGLTGTSNNYKFPVGKNNYWLYEFANINTTGTGNAVVTVEAFDAGPYAGLPGTGLGSIASNKYWQLNANMGSVAISNSTIRLNDPTLTANNKVAQSNTLTGIYNTLGGVFATGSVTSYKTIDYSAISTGTFFRIGTKGGSFPAGNYAIGPNGPYPGYAATYTTFQNAVNAIADIPIGGNVIFEFQPDYSPSVETYPVNLPSSINGNSSYNIIFRPAASVSSVINFTFTSTVLVFNGCSYIVIDGRNGGTGENKFIQFTNSSTSTQTVDIKGDAVSNQLLYCTLAGAVTSTSTGILTISGVQFTSTIGDDNTLIDHCNFNGQGTSANCIYAVGYSTAINDNVTISNNNFYDYRGANAAGLNIQTYNNNWTINGNSFYQTTAYTGVTGTMYGIYIASGSPNTIYGNSIGGNAPGCGGTWTVNPTTLVYNFTGMYLNLSTATTSKIYNNTVTNFSWSTRASTWTGIYLYGGNANIGTDGANYIGNNTTTGAITITYTSTAGTANVYGINTPLNLNQSNINVRIENNIIGSITTQGVATGASITGINSTCTNDIIRNNSIGSTTVASSINATTLPASLAQNVIGINCNPLLSIISGTVYNYGGNATVNGNTIANMNNAMTTSNATNGMSRGIKIGSVSLSASPTILVADSNLIYSITSAQPMTGTLAAYSMNIAGMDIEAATATSITITKNTIYDMSNTYSSASAINVVGLYAYLSSGIYNKIDKNLIYSLNSASPTAIQNGIYLASGIGTFQNNAIRLGIDKTGASITSTATIYGINKSTGTAGNCNFYFNTVYIGGTGVATGTGPTYDYYQASHTTEDIRNNIFVNVRKRTTATLTNFAAYYVGTLTSNFTSDYNIYNVTTTDGVIAFTTANQTTMKALRVALPGNDLHSGSGDPLLSAPANASASLNLSITNTSPAEGNGILIAAVTDDFSGNNRSSLTPTDIGAFAGNFTVASASQDIFSPVIIYTPLTNSAITGTGLRTLTGFAAITDQGTGVNNTTGTRPRLYYKKSTDANAFAANTSAGNGWKYVEASNTSSPYTFAINYALLRTAAAAGNIIQYYVVAQDQATTPNVTFNPLAGSVGTSVGTTGMTAPTTPNSYTIVSSVPAAISVGTGQTYTTLTGSTGVFNAINTGALSGNTVVTIVSDITEPGTVALNLIAHEEVAGVTLTIKPDASVHTLSGTTTTPLIGFNGPSLVTIDGGAGKLLTFRNNNATASTTGAVFSFYNGAFKDTIKNCYIESNETSAATGCVLLGAAPASKIAIYSCDIRDARAGALGNPANGIYSVITGNILYGINNNIYNWTSNGISLYNSGDSCVVSGNSFYMQNPVSVSQAAITFSGGNKHVISGNFVGGQAANCGGAALTTSGSFNPFNLSFGLYNNSIVQNNTVSNINASGAFTGYNLSGLFNFIGNTIGSATTSNSIQLSSTSFQNYYGVNVSSASPFTTFDQNVIANITLTMADGSPYFYAMKMDNGNVRKNKIYNIGTATVFTGAYSYPTIYGIYDGSGSGAKEYSNNMISLSAGANKMANIFGIYETSTSTLLSLYYNSINIYGDATGSLWSSFDLCFSLGTGFINVPTIIKDNILVMNRRNGSNSSDAIYSYYNSAPITSDYNDLYAYRDANSKWNFIGYGPSTNDTTLTMWQLTGHDLNSVSVLPAFISNSDLHIVSDPNIANYGTPVSVTDDIDGNLRCVLYPDMGINQFSACNAPNKKLNLTLLLEGLYKSNSVMNQAQGNAGNQYPGNTADQITVELHSAANYSTIVATYSNVNLTNSGLASITVPPAFNSSYYITVVPRNSIPTVSSLPLSFAANFINYNFTTSASQAFGSNEKLLATGIYGIYAGDVNQDGVVDVFDLAAVQNDAILFSTGYLLTDVNGDGAVDAFDISIVENNSLLFVSAVTP